ITRRVQHLAVGPQTAKTAPVPADVAGGGRVQDPPGLRCKSAGPADLLSGLTGMVPGRVYFALFLPALRDHMAALLAVSLRGRGRLLSSDRLLGVRQPISDRGWVDRILIILDGIHNQDVFRSDLRKQDRNVCLVANGSWGDGIQSMYEQPYAINKFSRAAATPTGRFTKLGKQFAKRGELHTPVPFFKFIPEVTGRLQSRDMNANVGGQVPEDGVVGLGFTTRPFTVALECLDLHFEARFNGSLPHRPIEVGLHQGVDVR
ncbi:hypothetical protein PENNAL_c0985G10862, partial [Penicillium nalgiovense]